MPRSPWTPYKDVLVSREHKDVRSDRAGAASYRPKGSGILQQFCLGVEEQSTRDFMR